MKYIHSYLYRLKYHDIFIFGIRRMNDVDQGQSNEELYVRIQSFICHYTSKIVYRHVIGCCVK